MHSRTQSGAPDWQDVQRLTAEDRREAQRIRNAERVKEVLAKLDRQPTPEEIATAEAVLAADPDAPQGELKLKGAK
jgi:hypothetical protein